MDIEFIDLAGREADPEAVVMVPMELAREYSLAPLWIDQTISPYELTVAVADVYACMAALDEIRQGARCRLHLKRADRTAILGMLERIYG